jgi:VWFA-related protein
MMNRQRFIIAALVAIPLGTLVGDGVASQDPTFRSRATIVPVAVRALDRNGDPVVGLTQSDFEVSEDGKPQAISYFAVEDYTIREAAPRSLERLTAPGTSQRVFVIVLGRGRLQGPSKGFNALFDFVKRASFERDRFAVVAFDRITDLTADRDAILRFLEHYQSEHEKIEAVFDHWFRGLTDFYGTGENPPRLDALIDRFFSHQGLPRSGQLALIRSTPADAKAGMSPEQTGESDGRYIYNAEARQDLERLRAAIGHLRVLNGEKHIIFVTPEGLVGLSTFYQDRLASLAADARVSLSVIHTGGLPTKWVRDGRSMVFEGPSWEHRWATATSRVLAEQTGGIASIYEFAGPALTRIEKGTRLHYLIGYVPTRVENGGAYRRVSVTVRRPDVTLHYRHGYFDAPDSTLSLEEERVASRIGAAQAYRGTIGDIRVEITGVGKADGSPRGVRTEIRIPPSALSFTVEEQRHVATVEVGVFVGENGRQIGQTRKRVDLRLTNENFAAVQRDGLQFTVTVPVPRGSPRHVKAVVYDLRGDRLGSTLFEVR